MAQVEKGLFVLVQKYMKSSRGDKNKVIQILKELCTLQQVATQYIKLREISPYKQGVFTVSQNNSEQSIQLL